MFTVTELQQIGASGGGMIIEADGFTVVELQRIAASAKGLVFLKNVNSLTVTDCQQIAASGREKVIFDFLS